MTAITIAIPLVATGYTTTMALMMAKEKCKENKPRDFKRQRHHATSKSRKIGSNEEFKHNYF